MINPRVPLSPVETRIYSMLKTTEGRWMTARELRDRIMPERHANNIKVHVRLMRLKGVEIETDRPGPGSKGYRLRGDNDGAVWTPAEVRLLLDRRAKGHSWSRLGIMFGRTGRACMNRWRREMGIQ